MSYRIIMNRILIISYIFLIGLISCNNSDKSIDKLGIAKKYFEALDKSNSSKIKTLLTDSLITAIPKYGYEVTFSRSDYIEKWLKWDSIFEPSYKILEMELENGNVKAKVSKSDKRIYFLMQKPFHTNEVLRFQNDKIIAVETEYLNFDKTTWEKNKNRLLNWIEENNPELNGFIYDQTESGAKKFLKAIELYEKK